MLSKEHRKTLEGYTKSARVHGPSNQVRLRHIGVRLAVPTQDTENSLIHVLRVLMCLLDVDSTGLGFIEPSCPYS